MKRLRWERWYLWRWRKLPPPLFVRKSEGFNRTTRRCCEIIWTSSRYATARNLKWLCASLIRWVKPSPPHQNYQYIPNIQTDVVVEASETEEPQHLESCSSSSSDSEIAIRMCFLSGSDFSSAQAQDVVVSEVWGASTTKSAGRSPEWCGFRSFKAG